MSTKGCPQPDRPPCTVNTKYIFGISDYTPQIADLLFIRSDPSKHEIWTIDLQNIVNGIIKRDAFKIVYVAPMKALAAEMTASFGKRLAPLGIKVRELTGDMQLTKAEIAQTQMLVTTPEKWDVVTRKPGDVSLAQLVRLVGGFL